MRLTSNFIFKSFKLSAKCTLPAYRVTKISNERMIDMQRSDRLPNLAPFRYGEGD